jgi:hypothetical protein
MRRALIIALGLASLGAIASVQPAAAYDAECTKLSILTCYPTFDPTTHKRIPCTNAQLDFIYNRCVANKAAKARAAGQSGALTTAKPGADIQTGKKTHPN